MVIDLRIAIASNSKRGCGDKQYAISNMRYAVLKLRISSESQSQSTYFFFDFSHLCR